MDGRMRGWMDGWGEKENEVEGSRDELMRG